MLIFLPLPCALFSQFSVWCSLSQGIYELLRLFLYESLLLIYKSMNDSQKLNNAGPLCLLDLGCKLYLHLCLTGAFLQSDSSYRKPSCCIMAMSACWRGKTLFLCLNCLQGHSSYDLDCNVP